MAARKKQALSQKLVGVATTGLPSPVRRVLQMRLVALLVVLALPVLWWTGIVTINTEGGIPRLSINREKAVEVEQRLAAEVQEYRGEHAPADGRFAPFANVQAEASNHGWPQRPGFLPKLGGQPEAPPSVFSGWGASPAPNTAPSNGWGVFPQQGAPQQGAPQQATNAWGQQNNAW